MVKEFVELKPGEVGMIGVSPGKQEEARRWTLEEDKTFERDWFFLKQQWSTQSIDREERHVIADMLEVHKQNIKITGAMAAQLIEPKPGEFRGMDPVGGYGMSRIRPDYICVAAQGRTYDYTLGGAVKDTYLGIFHNAAIGGAINTQLYLRKETILAICGILDTGGNPGFDEFLWETLGSEDHAIHVATEMMRGTNLAFYQFPKTIIIRPSSQYRFEGKANENSVSGTLIPVGVAFADFDTMKTLQPVQPTTAKP